MTVRRINRDKVTSRAKPLFVRAGRVGAVLSASWVRFRWIWWNKAWAGLSIASGKPRVFRFDGWIIPDGMIDRMAAKPGGWDR